MTIMSRRHGGLALVAALAATGALILAFALSTWPGHTRATVSISAFQALIPARHRPGGENLQDWAAYRLSVLRAEDASSAREDAAATELAFTGGTGSCIIDDYITRIGAHHYQELACLVQGRSGASVVMPGWQVADSMAGLVDRWLPRLHHEGGHFRVLCQPSRL